MRYPAYLLASIRDTLADLYPERGDILRLLADAGIAAQRVNLERDAAAVWNDVVNLADDLGLVRHLLHAALREYTSGPAREQLLALGIALQDADTLRYGPPPPPLQGEKNGAAPAWTG
jgi:hypothetical protein